MRSVGIASSNLCSISWPFMSQNHHNICLHYTSVALAVIRSAAMLHINVINNATSTVSLRFKKARPKLEFVGIIRRKCLSKDNFALWRPQTTIFWRSYFVAFLDLLQCWGPIMPQNMTLGISIPNSSSAARCLPWEWQTSQIRHRIFACPEKGTNFALRPRLSELYASMDLVLF